MKKRRIYVGSILVLLGIVELILTVSDQASVTKLIVAIAFRPGLVWLKQKSNSLLVSLWERLRPRSSSSEQGRFF